MNKRPENLRPVTFDNCRILWRNLKFCLVNDAVYIAKVGTAKDARKIGKWEAVGKQFQHPIVYKQLFSDEQVHFWDYAETKSVQTALYLDLENRESLEGVKRKDLKFIGKIGQFIPVLPPHGGPLLRAGKEDGEWSAATGTKGHRWLEADFVDEMDLVGEIDKSYYDKLVNDALDQLAKFGDVGTFLDK